MTWFNRTAEERDNIVEQNFSMIMDDPKSRNPDA
jgi:hypothetical protein